MIFQFCLLEKQFNFIHNTQIQVITHERVFDKVLVISLRNKGFPHTRIKEFKVEFNIKTIMRATLITGSSALLSSR